MGARKTLLSVLLAAALAACGGKPFEYHPGTEIPKGPGLLSGESGEFVIYSDKKVPAAAPPAGAQPQPVAAGASEASAAEFREFQEFREFRRWKESAKDTPEFREFQDWREWKAYRSWKQQQPK